MSAAATTSDTADDLLDNPLWILDCKVPQLKAAWQKLDQSGFEHTSNKHLRVEPIRPGFYKQFIAERASTTTGDQDETSECCMTNEHTSTRQELQGSCQIFRCITSPLAWQQ